VTNWQRGFLRLWIALAVVWIGLSGWYQYVNKPWNQDWGPFNTNSRCWDALAVWPDSQRMAPWDVLGNELDTPANIEANKRNHEWAADSIPERNRWAESVRQKLEKCQSQEPLAYRTSLLINRIWLSLNDTLPIILLPPMFLFVLGYVVAWIIRGFRAKA
jgi:hypothetical protein